jgi:fructan beta-fructosidase
MRSLFWLVLLICHSVRLSVDADDVIVADFETPTLDQWETEGDAFRGQPAAADKLQVTGFRGRRLINSFGSGDAAVGAMTSPSFEIGRRYVAFLIGGGRHEGEMGVELLIDGKSVRSATGEDSGLLRWVSWDVSEFKGKSARVRIFDRATGGWGHINVDQILQSDNRRTGTGAWRLDEYRRSPEYLKERFRPGYHFTPELNWMNDPNGLVYHDGEYHLFYQHNPLGNEWGHMSWGHAVSRDLVRWEHLPIAITEEYGVMAFSGCAVVDENNTSGLGSDGKPPLVALYTGHGHDRQTQDLAYSNDRGRTWTRYAGNPVLDIGEKEFRDPKVFWHAPTKRWIMVVALAVEKRIQFYGSPDLKAWTLLSEFGPAGAPNKLNWECPDLFELPVANASGESRWVLGANMGNGSVAGGSGEEYFVGRFDGVKFIPDAPESQWVDYGRDFYAAVSWSNVPKEDGRRLWIGWMNNWETCLNPTHPWRSAMSIPRELSLRRIGEQIRLCQQPVRELKSLRGEAWELKDRPIRGNVPIAIRGQQLELEVVFEIGQAKEVGLRVLKKAEQETVIRFDSANQTLSVDRTKSGNVAFHPAFAGQHTGPLRPDARGQIRLRVLVDACSVEVFGNDGETVITDLVFPDEDSVQAELFAEGEGARVIDCRVYPLKSAR